MTNIGAVSSVASVHNVQANGAAAVVDKVQENQELQGELAVELIDRAAQVADAEGRDARPAVDGKGLHVDVIA